MGGSVNEETMQHYTTRKGLYTRAELCLLSSSLGFPGNMLLDGLQSQSPDIEGAIDGKGVREKTIATLSESGVLYKKLDKVFNRYSTKYNVKMIKKAMHHIRHRSLRFSDITDARVAFELYSFEDARGIPTELSYVQQALKVLERTMSPSKLQMEIQRYNEVADVPSRLQMYEFFDIVALSIKTKEVREQEDSEASSLKSTAEVGEGTYSLALPDFDRILMTTDQRVSAYLEAKYRQSLYRRPEPTPAPLDTEKIVRTSSRRSLVSFASDQSRAISPCIERSQSQLNRARNGQSVLSESQFSDLYSKLDFTSPNKKNHSPTKYEIRDHHASDDIEILSAKGRGIQDPLSATSSTTYCVQHKEVRVRLQQLPRRKIQTKPLTSKVANASNTITENLKSTINNVCAGSVLRARAAVESSLAILPPHLLVYQLPSYSLQQHSEFARPPPQTGQRLHRPILKPVVSSRELKEHQGLIDELEWTGMQSRFQDS